MKTLIEINGHKYDARTGALIVDKPKTAVADKPVIKQSPVQAPIKRDYSRQTKRQVIDGIGHRPTLKPPVKKTNIINHTPAKSMQRSVEKSSTLLRTAVKKPAVKPQIQPLITHVRHHSNTPLAPLSPNVKPSQPQYNSYNRTVEVGKSAAISRFGEIEPKTLKPKLVNDLPVASVPVPKPKDDEKPLPPIDLALDQQKTDKKQKKQVFNHGVIKKQNRPASQLPKEKFIKRVSRNLKIKPKLIGVSAGAIALLLLGGFLAYQNVPIVSLKVAANRAGFNGRLPANIPAGFSYKGPIDYSKGIISLNYRSVSDSRKFSIVQQPSAWTSESLLTNYLIASKYRYQTYRDKGLTVFIYNEGNATWVDNGIWYNVVGQGSLTSDQILALAGSL